MRPALFLPSVLLVAAMAAAGLGAGWAQENAAREISAHETSSTQKASGAAAAVAAPNRLSVREQSCLSGGEMREVVSERKIVEPLVAIRAARDAVPRAEIVRVNLCHREGEPLFYLITALQRNGQFVHVTVDTKSGVVASFQ